MSYVLPNSQLNMVYDDIRNHYYHACLKEVITPESVVLDLGAGLGIFGMMAAKLGAKKVYMIEPHNIIHTTRSIVSHNNLSHKIKCIQGKIENITLPEKVDVITSAFTGNFLLEENLLPSLFYARDHFLKPSGMLIPDTARMNIALVNGDKLYQAVTRCDKENHGIDFSIIKPHALNTPIFKKPAAKNFIPCSNPEQIYQLDFYTDHEALCNTTSTLKITNNKPVHFIHGWFDIGFSDLWLNMGMENPKTHWTPVFFPLKPINPDLGNNITVRIKRGIKDEWLWQLSHNGEQQSYCSFHAKAHSTISCT